MPISSPTPTQAAARIAASSLHFWIHTPVLQGSTGLVAGILTDDRQNHGYSHLILYQFILHFLQKLMRIRSMFGDERSIPLSLVQRRKASATMSTSGVGFGACSRTISPQEPKLIDPCAGKGSITGASCDVPSAAEPFGPFAMANSDQLICN